MDAMITNEMIKSLSEGDLKRFIGYVAIFFFIWLEVRGMKRAIKDLGNNIATGFKAGEDRFDKIENNIKDFEHRLTVLEETKT